MVFECIPNKHGQGMRSVLPNQRLSKKYFQHWVDVLFLSSQFSIVPHTQTRIVISRLTKSIPNLELFPNRVQMELSRIAFPIKVLPEDGRTDFAEEERLDLPHWTTNLAICASVAVSKYLDILTLEFWAVRQHPPTLPECMLTRRQLLVRHSPAVLQWHPLLLLQSFVTQTK